MRIRPLIRPFVLAALCFALISSMALAASTSAQAPASPDEAAKHAAALAKAPRIEFTETEYVFPGAMDGDLVTHEFIFTNKGESDLLIQQVKAG